MADTFRTTTYLITGTSFSGLTYDLSLNQALASDYFVMVQGDNDTVDDMDAGTARVTGDEHGNLGATTSSGVIRLARHASTNNWVGSVTVVECLGDQAASGFTLVDVLEISDTTRSGTATTGTTFTLAQTVTFGGWNGGGAKMDAASTSSAEFSALSTRFWPSGTDTVNFDRTDSTGGAFKDVSYTVYVIEWGSEWTVDHVEVNGTPSSGDPTATTGYITGTVTSVTRDNTWVWGSGFTTDTSNDPDSHSPSELITLGDGVNQNASETSVAVGSYGGVEMHYDVFVMEHASLAVDYRFNNTSEPITVDAATAASTTYNAAYTEDLRIPVLTHATSSTGAAHENRYYGLLDASTEMELYFERGNSFVGAWVQAVDLAGITFGAGADYTLAAAQGSFSLSGQTASLLANRLLTAAQGSFTLTGQDASLLAGRKLTAGQGTYTLSGQDANLLVSRILTAAQGSFTLTGQDVTLTYNSAAADYTLTAASGTFSLSGQDAVLRASCLLTAESGTFTMTGQVADLLRGFYLAASQGTYNLSGQDASLLANRLITAGQGSFTLTGRAATLTYSGATEIATLTVSLSDVMTLGPTLSDVMTLEPTLSDTMTLEPTLSD